MNPINQSLLQISVENHSEPSIQGPSQLTCAILDFDGGYLRDGSDATDTCLPAPYDNNTPKASWYLQPDTDVLETSLTIVIFSTDNPDFPACPIKVNAKDVLRWSQNVEHNCLPEERTKTLQLKASASNNDYQVYHQGRYTILGHASIGDCGPVYTITAGLSH